MYTKNKLISPSIPKHIYLILNKVNKVCFQVDIVDNTNIGQLFKRIALINVMTVS